MEPTKSDPPPKRAARSKKGVATEGDAKPESAPVSDSIVNAFGGQVGPAIFIEEIEHVPTPVAKGKAKAKAVRKPAVIAQVTPDGIQGSLTPVAEQRPLIAHLPIRATDLENDMFAPTPSVQVDTPGHPNPYDSTEVYAVFGQEQQATPPPKKEEVAEAVVRPSLPLHHSERLMVRFQDANREQRLPDSTDVACFWDCHSFRGTPFVIPTVIEEGIWRVYGNFCCPECAAAFLFNERLDLHVQWERFALLNRLYSMDAEPIRLAPARTVLRLFGGAVDISDFRAIVADKRMRVDVMMPPMISIIQVMDTKPIDFYDASMKNTFIPWEMDRMNRPGAQGLRLRRTKPVAEKEATLEYCMGIVA